MDMVSEGNSYFLQGTLAWRLENIGGFLSAYSHSLSFSSVCLDMGYPIPDPQQMSSVYVPLSQTHQRACLSRSRIKLIMTTTVQSK